MAPSAPPRRIGLFGGTFDPPHFGHLLAAQETAWRLELGQVLFLPAHANPLKRDRVVSAAADRLRMVELAVGEDPRFAVSRLDLDRPPPSYTVTLLRLLRAQLGEGVDLVFLAGADVLTQLGEWYRPEELFALSRLAVFGRPGYPPPDAAALERAFPAAAGRVTVVPLPGVAISASDLRARVRTGAPITYLTPPAVEAFVRAAGLYRH